MNAPSLLRARLTRALLCASLGVAVTYTPACDHHDDETTPDDPGTVYQGGTNDEALAALEGAKTTESATGPALTAPAADAVLPATPAPAFTWSTGGSTGELLPRRAPSFTTPLPFGPLRRAHAHGAPVNGRAYLLTFTGASGSVVLRVFTTTTTYTPDAASWERIRTAGATVTAAVTTASFDNNNLVQDGGPTRGAPRTFTFAK